LVEPICKKAKGETKMPDETKPFPEQSTRDRSNPWSQLISLQRKLSINEFLRTALGLRMSTSDGGVSAGRGADHQKSSLDCLPTASVNVLMFRRRKWSR
jgi:hypothetical protein